MTTSSERTPGGEERAALTAWLEANLQTMRLADAALDDATADELHLNRTDLRTIEYVLHVGNTTPGELAKALGVSNGAVTFILGRLEQAGLVARRRDTGDGRRSVIEATAVARRRVAIAHADRENLFRAALANFSTGEIRTIQRFAALIAEQTTGQLQERRNTDDSDAPGRKRAVQPSP